MLKSAGWAGKRQEQAASEKNCVVFTLCGRREREGVGGVGGSDKVVNMRVLPQQERPGMTVCSVHVTEVGEDSGTWVVTMLKDVDAAFVRAREDGHMGVEHQRRPKIGGEHQTCEVFSNVAP